MKMTPVVSSNIAAIGYDLVCTELVVQFKNGKTFYYLEVSPEEHASLMAAESVGKHFNQFIKSIKVGSELTTAVDAGLTDKEKIELLREALKGCIEYIEEELGPNACTSDKALLETTKGGE